jgi:hypothetical protein
MFLSAYKAYEELSPGMKTYLEGKTATHDGARAYDKRTKSPIRPPSIRLSSDIPRPAKAAFCQSRIYQPH